MARRLTNLMLGACRVYVCSHHEACDHASAALLSLQEEVFGTVLTKTGADVDPERYIPVAASRHCDCGFCDYFIGLRFRMRPCPWVFYRVLSHMSLLLSRDGGCDRVSALAIAYHNLAVEQEFLARHDDCLINYRKVPVPCQFAGRGHFWSLC